MLKAASLSGEDWWDCPLALPCPARRYAAFYLQTNSVVLLRSITSGCEGLAAWTGLRSVIKEKCDIFIKEVRTRHWASGYISVRLTNFQTGDYTLRLHSFLLQFESIKKEPNWGLRCPKRLACSKLAQR